MTTETSGLNVNIQMERGGVTRTARGTLNLSLRRHRSNPGDMRSKVKGYLVQAGWRLLMFFCGLLVASLYGLTMFYVQNQPLWFTVYVTLVLAALAAFGMGVSAAARLSVLIMLPTLCSSRGRKILLLLFTSVLVSGPIANTVENTERAAASVLCGAELAANQTQELLQRSATPLLSALDKIRMISRNAYAVAGRVQKLMSAMTDGIRHVARTLRNVVHFLADIGDVCNDKLGTPFRKCRDVFLEARSDCESLLGEFNFLCVAVDIFLPLCNIARAAEVFCIVPSYISSYLKEHLAAPTIAAFERLRREFDFNISASFNLDVDADSSQSLQEATQNILREFSFKLKPLKTLSQPLTYLGLFLLAFSFYRAVMYRHNYLHQIGFDNFYISARFREIDRQITSEGGASVLPIRCNEAKTYITPLTCQLTSKEWKSALKGVATVLRYLLIGGLVVVLDFLLFWILDQVQHLVKADVVARSPVVVSVAVNGSGFSSSIIRDLISSFDILQTGNITVISRKCLKKPSEPNQITCFILGFLLGLALLVSLIGGLMQRLRRIICAAFYPERELERILFLRQKILDERRAERESMWKLPGVTHLSSCFSADCAGIPCSPCFPCVRPSTSQKNNEAQPEADSEALEMVPMATQRQSAGSSEGERDNEDSVGSDSEFSDLDMSYQYREESDESDSDHSGISV
ncbi:DC-STAMP domain-containing protein 2 [Gouania willdenowi]|uniref:DC-STAMP domain-containing protein 2 n=1 Tax=Gouania willdenowi TaxID=441366 RepID=UPI001054274F|nr:DC-STAMP domain-containing protein 2 [Gouania willdenowi]